MSDNDYIFSWAESLSTGQLVHVDSVPNGLKCGCICPNCKEQLLARHGEVNEHGFAHHSENRGANLKICYMVIMFKLAEQIVRTHRKIVLPTYHGIFKAKVITFDQVTTDGRFDREDRQPDVIATTSDGQKFLVEFIFGGEVRHRKPLDYNNLTCLEIDLRNQTLKTLEKFLLESDDDRKWLNNKLYFDSIEELYRQKGKNIKLKNKTECQSCEMHDECCAAKEKGTERLLQIAHNGELYRICKIDTLNDLIRQKEAFKQQEAQKERERQKQLEEIKNYKGLPPEEPHLRSCFNCMINLDYMNRNGKANCGSFKTYKTPQRPDPTYAQHCKCYRRKK